MLTAVVRGWHWMLEWVLQSHWQHFCPDSISRLTNQLEDSDLDVRIKVICSCHRDVCWGVDAYALLPTQWINVRNFGEFDEFFVPRGLKVGGNLSLSRCYYRVTNAEARWFVSYVLSQRESPLVQTGSHLVYPRTDIHELHRFSILCAFCARMWTTVGSCSPTLPQW